MMVVVACCTVLAGCVSEGEPDLMPQDQDNAEQETKADTSTRSSRIHIVEPVQPVSNVKIDPVVAQSAEMMKERLANTYARRAARRHDICPKLLVRNVDSNSLVRHGELLKDKYCDYFIYPVSGQYLGVTSNKASIQKNLITPDQYNFDNGSYLVQKTDKYVIRITHDGSGNRKPIDYDITISLTDDNK